MSLEVFLLGSGGMMPLPNRFLASAAVRRAGEIFLFDCGEGTQVSLKMLELHWKKISHIFITHMHADHVTGLPGLLMLSSQVDRTEPLVIVGPEKLGEYIDSNRKQLDMFINYEIIFKPVFNGTVLETDEYKINAFPLLHTKPCWGYSLIEKDRAGEFNVENAKALNIPCGPLWGELQRGNNVEVNGKTFTPDMVLGPARKGLKFSYVTDTMYLNTIAKNVYGSDLFICEGMFTRDLQEDAAQKKHMTSTQSANIALNANVKQMALTHFSPRYTKKDLKQVLNEAREIFPNTVLCEDGLVFEINNQD